MELYVAGWKNARGIFKDDDRLGQRTWVGELKKGDVFMIVKFVDPEVAFIVAPGGIGYVLLYIEDIEA